MIEINNVTFRYRKQQNPALDNISASFSPGIHLILGPNGAGKTTLLSMLDGAIRPQQGSCTLDSIDLTSHSPLAMEHVFMLSETTVYPMPKLTDMVRYHAPFYTGFDLTQMRNMLCAFQSDWEVPLASMSLGNRRKAQVGYAMALNTQVLLLDEPANGLDIVTQEHFTEILAGTDCTDRYIFISTHNIHELRNIFDTVTVIQNGRLLLSAPLDSIARHLSFVESPEPLPDTIYTEASFGHCSQIVRAAEPFETQVDIKMLYKALTSTPSTAQTIVSLLS